MIVLNSNPGEKKMKITFEFNIDDTDQGMMDKYEHDLYLRAHDMYTALSDLQEFRRRLYKGWIEYNVDQTIDELDEIIGKANIYDIQ